MSKKNRKIRRRPDGAPIWYAAQWLAHLNKSQAHIAARTEYTKSQISEWVNCKERFNADVLHAFAKALEIEASDLLRPPVQGDNELVRFVRNLDARQQERALKVLRAAEIAPANDKID